MKEAVVDQVEMSEPGAEYSRVDRVTASLFSAIKKGATLKDLHGIPQATMQGIYAYAYKFYRQGELDKAESFFRFLCMYDFSCAEYHLGLGAVYQLKGEYGRAIEYYGVARSLASHDYRSVLHSGQCHLCLGNIAAARECFASVKEKSRVPCLEQAASACLGALDDLTGIASRAA